MKTILKWLNIHSYCLAILLGCWVSGPFWNTVCLAQWTGVKPMLGEQIDFSHPLARALVGCWLMNEGGGDKAYDSSGNQNTGIAATAPTWVPGKFGLATRRTTYYQGAFNCGNGATLQNPNELTAVVWALHSGTEVGILFAKPEYYTATSAFNIDYLQFQDRLRFSVKEQYFNDTVGIWPVDTWACFAISYKKNSWGRCYKDGNFIGNLVGYADAIPLTENLNIGGFGTDMFTGVISHAMFYNRALEPSEIWKLYTDPFCMFVQERPELYVTAAAEEEESHVIFVSSIALYAPFVILIVCVYGLYVSRNRKGGWYGRQES